MQLSDLPQYVFGSVLMARQRAALLLRHVLDTPEEANVALTYWPQLLPHLGQDASLDVAYQMLWHFECDTGNNREGLRYSEPFYVDMQLELLKQASTYLARGEALPYDILSNYQLDKSHPSQPPRYWQGYQGGAGYQRYIQPWLDRGWAWLSVVLNHEAPGSKNGVSHLAWLVRACRALGRSVYGWLLPAFMRTTPTATTQQAFKSQTLLEARAEQQAISSITESKPPLLPLTGISIPVASYTTSTPPTATLPSKFKPQHTLHERQHCNPFALPSL